MSAFLKLALGICLLALLGVAGVFGTRALMSQENAQGGGGERGQATRVGLAAPEMRRIEDDFTGIGTIMPIRSVDIVPNVPGRVTGVPVSSGVAVAKGDLLIQIDDRAARATLAEAEATLSETENEYRRFEQLEDSNTAAEARLEEARAAFLRAEANVMAARAALEDLAITAPFGGTLGLIDVEPGAYLGADAAVTSLADLTRVKVAVSLPERYFDRVSPGQTVDVTTPAYPDRTFRGRVVVRAPQIDLATRSFDIRAEIDNPDTRLVGGMFANSRLIFDTYEALAIPDDAIISEGLTTYVYTVSDGTAARTEIAVGSSVGALTEVRDGLAADDRVVVAGWDNLSDGAPVEIDGDVAREGLE